MNSVSVFHRSWVITARVKKVLLESGSVGFRATAAIEKFTEVGNVVQTNREYDLRRIYGVSGLFGSDRMAIEAAISIAKKAIDKVA